MGHRRHPLELNVLCTWAEVDTAVLPRLPDCPVTNIIQVLLWSSFSRVLIFVDETFFCDFLRMMYFCLKLHSLQHFGTVLQAMSDVGVSRCLHLLTPRTATRVLFKMLNRILVRVIFITSA